jgi:cell division protein FtsN
MPQLSRRIDAVIMKCLQKDPAHRYRSADEFEGALVRAARARRASPWEVAVDRWIARTETEIRTRSRQGVENAVSFFKRQDWRSLLQIKEEPQAMLGLAGMIGALIVFLFVGGWKTPTINAQTLPPAAIQNSFAPIAAGSQPTALPTLLSAQNSVDPIASRQVDLYENFKTENAKPASVNSGSPVENLAAKPIARPDVSPKPPQTEKRAKSDVPVKQPKAKLNAGSSGRSQLSASSSQPENSATPEASSLSADEPAAIVSQPSNAPEPVFEKAYAGSQLEPAGVPAKMQQLYFEVGSFKEEAWAKSAVDKLTELGFHAVLIHKNLLWSQSYHVQVGPYSNQSDFVEARQSLAAQGFKPHPVN